MAGQQAEARVGAGVGHRHLPASIFRLHDVGVGLCRLRGWCGPRRTGCCNLQGQIIGGHMLSGRALLQWRPASNTDMLTASTSSVTCTQTQWVRGDAALTERARHGGQAGVHSCHTFSGDPRCAATTSGSSHSVRFSTFKWCIAVIVQEGLVGPPPASVRNASREGRERGGIRCSAVSRSVSLDRRIMYSTLSTEWSRVEATFNRLLLHYTYTADCLHGSVPKCCLRLRLRLRTAIIQPKSGSNAAVHKRSKDTL